MSIADSLNAVRLGSKFVVGFAKAKLRANAGDGVAVQYIMDALSTLGPGLPAKAAQLLAVGSASEPCDLSALVLDSDDVYRLLESEAPLLFADIETLSPIGIPGSLGQVHRAVLKSGQVLAVKVQYPDIAERIRGQLGALLSAAGFAAKVGTQHFNAQGFLGFFSDRLGEEVDYLHEAQNQSRFRQRFLANPNIIIPVVHQELSTHRVLVQDWVEYLPLAQAQTLPDAARQQLASALIDTFLTQLMVAGELHGDFHQGNVGWRAANPEELVLLDFGSTLKLQAAHVATLKEVIYALRRGIKLDALEAFCRLGFDERALRPLAGDLKALWRVFLRPFCSPKPFDPSKWNFREESSVLLGAHRMAFRLAGPPWFLMLMKTFSGLNSCLCALATPVDTSRCIEPLLEGALGAMPAQVRQPAQAPLPSPAGAAGALWIRVSEDGEDKILLEMPVRAVENLEDLVPDDAKDSLRSLGHDLASMRARVLASGSVPQVIFDELLGRRAVRIWLA